MGDGVQKAAEAEGKTMYKVQDKIHVWKRTLLRKKSWAMKDHPVFHASQCALLLHKLNSFHLNPFHYSEGGIQLSEQYCGAALGCNGVPRTSRSRSAGYKHI